MGLFGELGALVANAPTDPSEFPYGYPYRPCEVSDHHYACKTVGYRNAVIHTLRVQVGKQVVTQRFVLDVKDCAAQTVHADIRVCELPRPLQVEVVATEDSPLPPLVVSTSYEAGAPYPCVEAPTSSEYLGVFLCPAALGSVRGSGHYEVFARGGDRLFRGSYERTRVGCTSSEGPLGLTEVE